MKDTERRTCGAPGSNPLIEFLPFARRNLTVARAFSFLAVSSADG